ncbi:hypothetical protein NDU88_004089 [Pleurodeles waltl]|uniref:Uncharacterized protein n=1 Tax=Pleurodeles waltl TaxID=8319 RepID=A0AAV7VG32_PLEWA|nr:hypothetical protein NDU88_004089 [Pleurodeles waltl]
MPMSLSPWGPSASQLTHISGALVWLHPIWGRSPGSAGTKCCHYLLQAVGGGIEEATSIGRCTGATRLGRQSGSDGSGAARSSRSQGPLYASQGPRRHRIRQLQKGKEAVLTSQGSDTTQLSKLSCS